MAYTVIDDGTAFFQTALWSGDNSDSRNIINVGNSDLQPDWVWIKCRNTTGNGFSHNVWDTQRGVSSSINTGLFTDVTDQEGGGDSITTTAQLGGVSAMLSDGFTVKEGSSSDDARYVNENSRTYVAWQWKCNGGTETTNQSESGSQIACSVQANTTAGFSIITYTGTGGTGHTFLHGLGSAPSFFIIKRRSGTEDWLVYHSSNTSDPATDHLLLNTTDGTSDSATRFDDTAPNGTEIALGNNAVCNGDASTYVCYAWKEVQGYSAFGSYTGNGSADGPFIYTGFKPAWLLFKRTDASGNSWGLVDNRRNKNDTEDVSNVIDAYMNPDLDNDDGGNSATTDFLSNGFKHRRSGGFINNDGSTYIYAAFAENPFVSSEGIPTTAR